MKSRNFGQVKRQKEASRKARQQEKLDRKHARGTKPAEGEPGEASEPGEPVVSETTPVEPNATP
jgi:hypothetical protein